MFSRSSMVKDEPIYDRFYFLDIFHMNPDVVYILHASIARHISGLDTSLFSCCEVSTKGL